MRFAFNILIFTFTAHLVFAQEPTIGLVATNNKVFDGYTILSTHHSTTTYLLDNCGFVVHSWESDYFPGNTARLTSSGKLLRATKVNSDKFLAGGAGGRIELVNWDGSIEWEFTYLSDLYRHHHDVLEMPNGNILILSWDAHEKADAIASGRNPDYLGEDNEDVWSEHIIEVKPLPNNAYEIVWEWYLWDHLVQDFDDSMANYGIISDHPEKININYVANAANNPDWIHANGIDYNAELDQIVISAFRFDEIWLIDHSTTSNEAKGSTGGNSGMGGDILYRWGNPSAYDRGSIEDQKLFNQHNPHWTGSATEMMIFNNGRGREPQFSSVDFVALPFSNGKYNMDSDGTFGPKNLTRTYSSDEIPEFKYSRNISGAIELENGNVLICSGANGNIVELTYEGEVVWNYINPITSVGTVEQGYLFEANPATRNNVFRAYKYGSNFIGFEGKELVRKQRIELEPLDIYPCNEIVLDVDIRPEENLSLYPNPVHPNDHFFLKAGNAKVKDISIINSMGQPMETSWDYTDNDIIQINSSMLSLGIYIMRITSDNAQNTLKLRVVE